MAEFLSTGSTSRPATPYKPLLYLNGVTVSFDGFRALDGLSFYVEPGEMRAIIGPNGAGKTTMMDVVTGRIKPDSGEVVFRGTVDLTQHDEAYIANLGIGRKFQQPTVFEQQSVFENLELALKAIRLPAGDTRKRPYARSSMSRSKVSPLLKTRTALTGLSG